MTKQEILDNFKDINEAYNNCTMLDLLSSMLDELMESQPQIVHCKDCAFRENHGADSPQWLPCMDVTYPYDFFCARGIKKDGVT